MTTPIITIGIDVAKSSLEAAVFPKQPKGEKSIENTTAGIEGLLSWLNQFPGEKQVILEATGGYQKPLMQALHAAGITVCQVQPQHAWFYARACGIQAKTDRLDAGMLARFGHAMRLRAHTPLSPVQQELQDLCRERQFVVECLKKEKTRLKNLQSMGTDTTVSLVEERLKLLEKQQEDLEKRLRQTVRKDARLKKLADAFLSVSGIGDITVYTVLAEMPEIGILSDKQAASLAGLAPFNRESGQWKGKSMVRGGRKPVRCVLYMAAVAASRSNPPIREFFQRLREKGKPFKVAITAVMRKLLIILNAIAAKQLKTA